MTTLKDKIRDQVMIYHQDSEKGAAPDPEVLVEGIMDEIKEYVTNVLLTD